MTKDMNMMHTIYGMRADSRKARRLVNFSLGDRTFVRLLLLLLMMSVGVGKAVGQIEEGFYRLKNQANVTYYLCPASTSNYNYNGNPFVTTYNSGIDYKEYVWEVKKTDDGFFYIINVNTKQYLTFNGTQDPDVTKRRVHLESSSSPDDNMKFEISSNGDVFNIHPISQSLEDAKKDNNAPCAYLNPHSGNQNQKTGEKGLIGFWTASDPGSKWQFEKVNNPNCTNPVINNSETSVTISSGTGTDVYYTTGTEPLSFLETKYTEGFTAGNNTLTLVRAFAKSEGNGFSGVSTKYIDTRTTIEPPVISVSESSVIITADYADIYYTTDGTAPTTSGNKYQGVISLVAGKYSIKAIAVAKGNSSVVSSMTETVLDLRATIPAPVINYDASTKNLSFVLGTGSVTGDNIQYKIYKASEDEPTAWSDYTLGNTMTLENGYKYYVLARTVSEASNGAFYSSTATKVINLHEALYEKAQYYVLHQNGAGYLRINNANVTLSNDGGLKYGELFNGNGNSFWILTEDGYLQNEYYYLNVANDKTLILSTNPVTQWELEDVTGNTHGKKHIKTKDTNLYLYYDSGAKVAASPSKYYSACPVEITESNWSGPSTDALTLQSTQLMTYLRHYFTQTFSYSYYDDSGAHKSENNKTRRVYAKLEYKSGGDDQGTTWDIAGNIIYNKGTENISVTATYKMVPADPIAAEAHLIAIEKELTFTIQPSVFTPESSKNYLLYYVQNTQNYRFPYDKSEKSVGDLVPADAKVADVLTESNGEISWKIEKDECGLVSFKNVQTGRYLYFDSKHYTANTDYGTVLIGSTTLPSDDNRYKFRLFKVASVDATYGEVLNIIPFEHQFVVYKSDGISNDVFSSFNIYANDKGISLWKPSDSKWKIYAYEVEDRMGDWAIVGPSSAPETGGYTFKVENPYTRNIVGSPDMTLQIKDPTLKTLTYNWSLSSELSSYASIPDGSNNQKVVTVASMPPSPITGEVQLRITIGDEGAYVFDRSEIAYFTLYTEFAEPTDADFTLIESLSQITNASGYYKLKNDVSDVVPETCRNFTGYLDGDGHTISGLRTPLFTTLSEHAIVRNLNLSDVSIDGTGNIGAIAGTISGTAKIYNVGVLDGHLSSTDGNNCGGIVGQINDYSRVINCFSYADIRSGNYVGGIVGYNSFASISSNIKTIVMNCMYYGDITGGAHISPVYGGEMIRNNQLSASDAGINTFNFYRANAQLGSSPIYNCALPAEDRYLRRFEFYRYLLNSNRELAAWYVLNQHPTNTHEVIYKWVLETADRNSSNTAVRKPYPVLKKQGVYPSIVNYDAEHAPASTTTERNQGKQMGSLPLTINLGSGYPAGAAIKDNSQLPSKLTGNGSLRLIITDKDYERFNFNYRKVQLPYYNEVGTGNYTGNKVVTGWKVSFTGGTVGTFTASDTNGGYNFADRDCTAKDDFTTTGRIYSQGAYVDVPNGVTAISITAYWGTAAYLSDTNYDVTYTSSYGGQLGYFTAPGTRYSNKTDYTINGSETKQKVYTSMSDALGALTRNGSVYDYAVVLVGNYHMSLTKTAAFQNEDKPFTVMSADLDYDNEPDYSFIFSGNDRNAINPVRFDFLNFIGIGMAQKTNESETVPGIAIFRPRGWFEVTNTCLARFTEFEYETDVKNVNGPLILQGGEYDQIVSSFHVPKNKTTYIHLGSNAWFKMFNNGYHAKGGLAGRPGTPHIPISVTGGDFEEFYLSGMFAPSAPVAKDDAECYISGGRFGDVAGAGHEKIDGNVSWVINYADIRNFYGGGINETNPITGDIGISIKNSHVDMFCGGPKFGNMQSEKTVTTEANNCVFGTFFGAGYGGTSYNRVNTRDVTDNLNYTFSSWASDYKRDYNSANGGIATDFEYEHFAYAGFSDPKNVGRLYVKYASLSLATTHDVSSNLLGCEILTNFYGGGNLGTVDGNISSTLIDCKVHGNTYGAGFSATVPTVPVLPLGTTFSTNPSYNPVIGAYSPGVLSADYVIYTWSNTKGSSSTPFSDEDGHWIFTDKDLTNLGTVKGNATLTLDGTTVAENVFGGGDDSRTLGNTTVTLKGNTHVLGSVYGGGNKAVVQGNTTVNIPATDGQQTP